MNFPICRFSQAQILVKMFPINIKKRWKKKCEIKKKNIFLWKLQFVSWIWFWCGNFFEALSNAVVEAFWWCVATCWNCKGQWRTFEDYRGKEKTFWPFLHSTVESRFSKVNFLPAVCLHFLASFQLFIYFLATFCLLLTALYLHLKYWQKLY